MMDSWFPLRNLVLIMIFDVTEFIWDNFLFICNSDFILFFSFLSFSFEMHETEAGRKSDTLQNISLIPVDILQWLQVIQY